MANKKCIGSKFDDFLEEEGLLQESESVAIKSEKIVELIRYCQRRSLLNKLIEQINRDRDNLLSDLRLD